MRYIGGVQWPRDFVIQPLLQSGSPVWRPISVLIICFASSIRPSAFAAAINARRIAWLWSCLPGRTIGRQCVAPLVVPKPGCVARLDRPETPSFPMKRAPRSWCRHPAGLGRTAQGIHRPTNHRANHPGHRPPCLNRHHRPTGHRAIHRDRRDHLGPMQPPPPCCDIEPWPALSNCSSKSLVFMTMSSSIGVIQSGNDSPRRQMRHHRLADVNPLSPLTPTPFGCECSTLANPMPTGSTNTWTAT